MGSEMMGLGMMDSYEHNRGREALLQPDSIGLSSLLQE